MKTYRFLGLELKIAFCLSRVKRLEIDIPSWADDCYVHKSDTPDAIVRYWKGGEVYFIELPKCKKAKEISCSGMYEIIDDKREYAKNRKIVVDIYLW